MHTRYGSLHLCIVTRTFTSGCLQHCKGAKYMLYCFQSKNFLYESMEWNMEENFSMKWYVEWKIFNMEWKWNGRKLPLYNVEKSSSIPCPAISNTAFQNFVTPEKDDFAKFFCRMRNEHSCRSVQSSSILAEV